VELIYDRHSVTIELLDDIFSKEKGMDVTRVMQNRVVLIPPLRY
jgi:hypothetical protein